MCQRRCRSSLLDSSQEIRDIKNRGELIPDTVVGDALLNNIFDAGAAPGAGILIDGFPRTALQVVHSLRKKAAESLGRLLAVHLWWRMSIGMSCTRLVRSANSLICRIRVNFLSL